MLVWEDSCRSAILLAKSSGVLAADGLGVGDLFAQIPALFLPTLDQLATRVSEAYYVVNK